jgi:purine-binding chemotaxis protein CheW
MTSLYVLFQVAQSHYVLDAADVLLMESFTGATQVPGSPAHVVGIIQLRGRVLPVIDLRTRFGMEARTPSLDSRVVVVKQADRAVALLADRAREVLRLDPAKFREAPEVGADSGQGFVKSVAHAGERLVMLLDVPKVIGEDVSHGG